MKSLSQLIAHLQSRIEADKEIVRSFAEKIAKAENPGYHFSWSQTEFDAAARIEVYSQMVRTATNVDSASDANYERFSKEELPPIEGESRFEWYRRYTRFTAASNMDMSTGSMPTGNVYRAAVNAVWRSVATDQLGIFYGF